MLNSIYNLVFLQMSNKFKCLFLNFKFSLVNICFALNLDTYYVIYVKLGISAYYVWTIKFTIFEGSMLKLDDQLWIKNESQQLYSHVHALFEGSQLHVPSVVPKVDHHFEKPLMGFELEWLSNHPAQFHLKSNRMF